MPLDWKCMHGSLTPGAAMARRGSGLTRRSFFVSSPVLRRARRALGASSDAEAVRISVERIAEMETFWRLMKRNRGRLPPGSFEAP